MIWTNWRNFAKSGHTGPNDFREQFSSSDEESLMSLAIKVVIRSGSVTASVTRFGEISQLGQTFNNLRQHFEGLFLVLQNFEPTLAIFYKYWENLNCCK